MTIVEITMYVLVASFIAIVILGHVLLASALWRCAREDLTGGRRQASAARSRRPLRRFRALVTHYARAVAALSERRAPRVG